MTVLSSCGRTLRGRKNTIEGYDTVKKKFEFEGEERATDWLAWRRLKKRSVTCFGSQRGPKASERPR